MYINCKYMGIIFYIGCLVWLFAVASWPHVYRRVTHVLHVTTRDHTCSAWLAWPFITNKQGFWSGLISGSNLSGQTGSEIGSRPLCHLYFMKKPFMTILIRDWFLFHFLTVLSHIIYNFKMCSISIGHPFPHWLTYSLTLPSESHVIGIL